MKKILLSGLVLLLMVPAALIFVFATMMNPQKGLVPTTINDFFLPGSQPGQSGTITHPDQCDNCHGGYDLNVEPAFNWRGSMMAQAQRDPLYLAALAIANQDAPASGDLCIRCHTPKGWLEGRSIPTDGSALIAADREGVSCHFCHKMIAPTPIGVNPYPWDALYTTPLGNNKPSTYTIDQNYLVTLSMIPGTNANGMYVVDNNDNRRGPYFDPPANHNTPYSPFHFDSKLCGTCHDVSNPVYATQYDAQGNIIGYAPGNFDTPAADFSPYAQFPIERTYSEWLMSEYNTPGGVSGTYFGGNKPFVSTCQDCHMRDVTGKGCNKANAPVRNDLPLHDMTGGNTFVPDLVKAKYPGEVDAAALDAGKLRALDMLQHAATVELTVDQMNSDVKVKVINETGHKLSSGYPEGRRIWINLKAYNSMTTQTFESGHYDFTTAYLTKTGTKIYEIKPGLSPFIASVVGKQPGESFHFVINDTIYLDNRIPPRGFTNANFNTIQSPVVGYSYPDGQYWDETSYSLPFIPDSVEVTLYYQTASREFIEFLRDENYTNNAGLELYNLWSAHGKSAPVVMNYETWSGDPVAVNTTLDLKVYLEGPFQGASMTTLINQYNYLPLNQPYNGLPWNYPGTESVTSIPNASIVDWLLLELRETDGSAGSATISTRIAQKAVFLKNNGSIVDLDGSSLPEFNLAISQNLFVVIWHRNHLGIISANPVTGSEGIYAYDFTSSIGQVYGGQAAHKEISPGKWGMVAADGNADGVVDMNDKNDTWMTQAGLSGYYSGDFNLDTRVNNIDKNDFLIQNTGYGNQVPNGYPLKYFKSSVPK
jgi:hypothetical protein